MLCVRANCQVMSLGAMIYGYRNNFNCKTYSRTKGRKTKLKLFNLITKGYRTASRYDDDYFISLCQYFMKKGYPCSLSVSNDTSNIDGFFMDALFSICPFHYENLIINKKGFNVFEWRKQLELFDEVEIRGLNFYRHRSAMPLEDFTSLSDVYKIIFTKYDKYNSVNEKLNFSFNSSWADAVWILSKGCIVAKDKIYYVISYGCEDDYKDNLNSKSHSSWEITIESETNENYVDFCLRVYQHYEEIISGSKNILQSTWYEGTDNFYLGGNFKLRTVTA